MNRCWYRNCHFYSLQITEMSTKYERHKTQIYSEETDRSHLPPILDCQTKIVNFTLSRNGLIGIYLHSVASTPSHSTAAPFLKNS